MSDDLQGLLIPIEREANLQLPSSYLLDYYIDRENRIYWLDDEVTDSTLELIKMIIRINREDKKIPIEERKPIRIIFNSPGGELDIEESIVSIIELSETPIWGIAIGCVASAASLIYLACHKRFATNNAYFIFHKGSASGISGNYNEIRAMMDNYNQKVDKLIDAYIKYTAFSEEEVKEKINTDWYVYTDNALEHKVIDQIVEDIGVFFD